MINVNDAILNNPIWKISPKQYIVPPISINSWGYIINLYVPIGIRIGIIIFIKWGIDGLYPSIYLFSTKI